ncbi:MAG TPA: hypothetical protein VFI68_02935 [Anaerolineales bacterium]|nr:hypothetical protein [Anaerolineales bacterium]
MQHIVKTALRSTGFLLVGTGTIGDLIAGLAILNHQLEFGMSMHVIAGLIWVMGLMIVDKHHAVPAAVFGSILFPGTGTFGWTLASGIASFSQGRKKTMNDKEGAQVDLLSDIRGAIEMPLETQIRPIVEVLYTSDLKIKRAALDLICREPSPQGMTLARRFLADSDPDVRALAAVAVSRLESHLSELMKSGLSQVEVQPQNPECHATMGHLYLEYAGRSGANSMNRSFYLAQARKAFEKAIALDSMRDDYQIALAEVLMNMRDYAKAWDTLAEVLKERPHDSQIYLLGSEIAFRARRFDRVIDLVKQARAVLSENDDVLPIMNWWLAFEAVTLR